MTFMQSGTGTMKKPHAIRATTLVVALLTSLLASCGGDKPDSLIASGKDFLAKNNINAAIIQFKNALQQNPDLGEARFLLGKALLDGGDPRGAEVELRKAYNLEFSPDLTIPVLAKAMLAGGQTSKVTSLSLCQHQSYFHIYQQQLKASLSGY